VTVFVDGNRVTPGTEKCRCTIECEWPCWQRLGLTAEPCCPDCAPLPEPEPEEIADVIPLRP